MKSEKLYLVIKVGRTCRKHEGFWLENIKKRKPLGRPKYVWKDNIKTNFRDTTKGHILKSCVSGWAKVGSCKHSNQIPRNTGIYCNSRITTAFPIQTTPHEVMQEIISSYYAQWGPLHNMCSSSHTVMTRSRIRWTEGMRKATGY